MPINVLMSNRVGAALLLEWVVGNPIIATAQMTDGNVGISIQWVSDPAHQISLRLIVSFAKIDTEHREKGSFVPYLKDFDFHTRVPPHAL
jgi:hypothetical protein